jgi:hypothetical protein
VKKRSSKRKDPKDVAASSYADSVRYAWSPERARDTPRQISLPTALRAVTAALNVRMCCALISKAKRGVEAILG